MGGWGRVNTEHESIYTYTSFTNSYIYIYIMQIIYYYISSFPKCFQAAATARMSSTQIRISPGQCVAGPSENLTCEGPRCATSLRVDSS